MKTVTFFLVFKTQDACMQLKHQVRVVFSFVERKINAYIQYIKQFRVLTFYLPINLYLKLLWECLVLNFGD